MRREQDDVEAEAYYFEVSKGGRVRRIPLEGDRLTIGRAPGSDIMFPKDLIMSRTHAAVERFGMGWTLLDLGSANGTSVNGTRILSARVLHPGDVVVVGDTSLRFRGPTEPTAPTTRAVAPPRLTPREHDALVALCRPLLRGGAFPQPATVKEMAEKLFVGDAAVKSLLSILYDKFNIPSEGDIARRVRLANAAIDSGAVTYPDLEEPPEDDEAPDDPTSS